MNERQLPIITSEEEKEKLTSLTDPQEPRRFEVTSVLDKPYSRDEKMEDEKIMLARVLLCGLIVIICVAYAIEYFRNEKTSPLDVLTAFLIGIVGILIGFLFPAKYK